VGFLDKLRGKKEEPDPAKARAEAATSELATWLASVMSRLQPDQVQFQPGETLGQVFARVFDEEERAVRTAGGDPVVQQLKLESINRLRQQFPAGDAPAGAPVESSEAGGQAMSEAAERPSEASYEVNLGGEEELKSVPMSMLLQLISGWETIVKGLGAQRRLPDSLLSEYKGAVVTVVDNGGKEELVLLFHAAKDMIQLYRE
jgi:hypothetical protein